MRAGERLRLNDQIPVYLFSRNEAFGTSPKKVCEMAYTSVKDEKKSFLSGETTACLCWLCAKIAICVDTSLEIVNAAKSWTFA